MPNPPADGGGLLHPPVPDGAAPRLRHHAEGGAALLREGAPGCRDPLRGAEHPGWIASGAQEGRQKRYRLTPQGREALTGALDRRLRRILALLLPILALSLFAGRNGLEQMGILNLLLALFLTAGIGKLWRKIKELQAQQDIFDTLS